MAVSKLHDSGFGRTGIHGHFRASCVAFASQMEAATSICHPREVIYRDSSLGRATLGASSQEAVAGQRVHISIRADSRCASSMGTGFLGVSLQEDVGTSWPGTEPQSVPWPPNRHPVAGAVCHPDTSEAADATYLVKDPTSARTSEPAAIPRVAGHSSSPQARPMATVLREWERVRSLHSSRVGIPQQEAVVWKLLPASRRPTASHNSRSLVGAPVGDTKDQGNGRVLDAVPRCVRNPRRTLQSQHPVLPTSNETPRHEVLTCPHA